MIFSPGNDLNIRLRNSIRAAFVKFAAVIAGAALAGAAPALAADQLSGPAIASAASLGAVSLAPVQSAPVQPAPVQSAVATKPDASFRSLFMSWKKLDQVAQGVISIPSQKPLASMLNFSSGYGVRADPFRRTAAMHAGIDLPGPIGTPIYATADGIVDRAEWANGYGNLVELNHGRGIQTRYGHLSKLLVTAGARVKRGDLIALMGSTGRSTGSHLHYEVRIDGRAVNPVPFLQSSDYLLAMQRGVGTSQVAMGGPEN